MYFDVVVCVRLVQLHSAILVPQLVGVWKQPKGVGGERDGQHEIEQASESPVHGDTSRRETIPQNDQNVLYILLY